MKEIITGLDERKIKYQTLLTHQNLFHSAALFSLLKIKNIKPEWNMTEIAELEPYYIRSSLAQINKK